MGKDVFQPLRSNEIRSHMSHLVGFDRKRTVDPSADAYMPYFRCDATPGSAPGTNRVASSLSNLSSWRNYRSRQGLASRGFLHASARRSLVAAPRCGYCIADADTAVRPERHRLCGEGDPARAVADAAVARYRWFAGMTRIWEICQTALNPRNHYTCKAEQP